MAWTIRHYIFPYLDVNIWNVWTDIEYIFFLSTVEYKIKFSSNVFNVISWEIWVKKRKFPKPITKTNANNFMIVYVSVWIINWNQIHRNKRLRKQTKMHFPFTNCFRCRLFFALKYSPHRILSKACHCTGFVFV